MKTRISHSLDETRAIASQWLSSAASKASEDEATVIGLSGHLGAGKTAFVKCVAKELGIGEEVTSPTFVIMKMYEISKQKAKSNKQDRASWPWKRLVHIDAYRLERREELEAISFEAVVSDPHNLVMIEWPENAGLNENPELQVLKFGIEGGEYRIAE